MISLENSQSNYCIKPWSTLAQPATIPHFRCNPALVMGQVFPAIKSEGFSSSLKPLRCLFRCHLTLATDPKTQLHTYFSMSSGSPKPAHSNPSLHWLSVAACNQYKTVNFAYKTKSRPAHETQLAITLSSSHKHGLI